MSLKSNIVLQLGLTDVDTKYITLYNISFEVQKALDFNKERTKLLSEVRDYTHVNYPRLKFLYDVAQKVAASQMQGAFVEAGVWRGGCAGILTYISKTHNYKHPLYFFDSFEGLPQPREEDGIDSHKFANNNSNGGLKSINKVKAEEDYIKELLFNKLGADQNKVNIIKGWFQDTLPVYKEKVGPIAILRLDGDWYESTKVSLENLYDLVVPGGYIIIDDYHYWDGCKRAVLEFIENRGLNVEVKRQDVSGVYFVKP
jgi:hypothetical protein